VSPSRSAAPVSKPPPRASSSLSIARRTNLEYVTVKLRPGSSGTPAPPVNAAPAIPEDARSAFAAGNEAYAKGVVAKAQEAFLKAIASYPKYVSAHNNLGVLYMRQNDKEKAREEFTKVIELDASFAPAHINLARLAIAAQEFSEAEQQLDKAAALDPNSLSAMVLMTSTAFANRNYDKALAYARKVHSLPQHEQFADVHLVAGQVLTQQKKDSEAIAEFELL